MTKKERFQRDLLRETEGMVKGSREWREQVLFLLKKYKKEVEK